MSSTHPSSTMSRHWRSPSRLRAWGLWLVLTAFALLALGYNLIVPIFEAPDENHHFYYVRHLAAGKGLPVMDVENPGLLAQEAGQPPLYYALAAMLTGWVGRADEMTALAENPHANLGDPLKPGNKNRFIHTEGESWPWDDLTRAVRAARLFSILLGLGTVYFTYRLALAVRPGQWALALAASALVAFTPQFLFISAAVSNDNLMTFLATLILWLLAKICYYEESDRNLQKSHKLAVLLGVFLGLSLLIKLSAISLLGLSFFALFMQGWREKAWRDAVFRVVILSFLAALIAGWWYARNLQLYGDASALTPFLTIVGPRVSPLTWQGLPHELQGLHISLLAIFGWFNILLPEPIYKAWAVFWALAGVGGFFAVWKQIRRSKRRVKYERAPVRRWPLALHPLHLAGPALQSPVFLLLLWFLLALAALLRWTSLTPASQGRLLFPAIAAYAFLLLMGWRQLWRHQALALIVPPAALLILSLLSLFAVIRPAYEKPSLLPPNAVIASPTSLLIDDRILLLDLEAAPTTLHPGQRLDLTLYWQAQTQVPYDASLFVRLLDWSNQSVAEINAYPGWGGFPTSQWPVGPIVRDRYWLTVPFGLETPTLLKVDVGMYDYASGRGYAARFLSGEPPPPGLLSLRALAASPPKYDIEQPVDFDFGAQARLLGYEILDDSVMKPGGVLRLALYWRGEQAMTEDYQIFVHLLDEQGARVAGYDKAPLDGRWPTSAWEPGRTLRDEYFLPIPIDLTVEPLYTVAVGLYRLDTLERLPVAGPDELVRDRAALLTKIQLRP
ncbi:MAG: hypothetical protein GXP42_12070 [Chloroflexi bacterium]|nr:hypothetical protein [Chloroflexota bacterium]